MQRFLVTETADLRSLKEWMYELEKGMGVKVDHREKEDFYLVEKLNRVIIPELVVGAALIVRKHLYEIGLLDKIESICSVETSGPKWAEPLAIALNLPYFSIHQGMRGNLVEPVSLPSRSPSREKPVELTVDKDIVRKYGKRTMVFEDITRGYGSIADGYTLLTQKAEADVLALYSFFLWDFVPHPRKKDVPMEIYHPLFVVKNISPNGEFEFDPDSLGFKYL